MKTTATKGAVSSPPEEKWRWSQQWRQNISRARQKLRADWKNDLQIHGAGRKSRKQPTPFVGIKPYGKCQITWFNANAFGGTNYSNTPVGAVTHVDEPITSGEENPYVYYGDWATGKIFALTVWDALLSNPAHDYYRCAAIGDPFITK